jgi:hypothetical protein
MCSLWTAVATTMFQRLKLLNLFLGNKKGWRCLSASKAAPEAMKIEISSPISFELPWRFQRNRCKSHLYPKPLDLLAQPPLHRAK